MGRLPCPKCKGRGSVGINVVTGEDAQCNRCRGTGRKHPQPSGLPYQIDGKDYYKFSGGN